MPFGGELLRAADVVDVVGVAAVDQRVVLFEERQEICDRRVDDRGRHHQPDRARLRQLLHEVGERGGADRLLLDEPGDGLGRPVEDDAVVAAADQPANHVRPHPSESDHSELHGVLLLRPLVRVSGRLLQFAISANQRLRGSVVGKRGLTPLSVSAVPGARRPAGGRSPHLAECRPRAGAATGVSACAGGSKPLQTEQETLPARVGMVLAIRDPKISRDRAGKTPDKRIERTHP